MQRQEIVDVVMQRAVNARELAELKRAERAMWARGDYGAIARRMFWEVGARIVGRLQVGPGDDVLDVACGTGNAAIRAAAAGARVVGLDLTPELLEAGKRLAAEASVDVEWVEGDAESLPFEDASFDVVVSTFGCMFAPRHDLTARELARVLRPGGRMALASWTPESSLAELMRVLIAVLPPGPEFAQPPPLWGVEEHVRGLFGGSGLSLDFARESVEFHFDSVEHALAFYETTWGPFIEARQLERAGRWAQVRRQLGAILDRHNSSAGPDLRYAGEYLVVVGTR